MGRTRRFDRGPANGRNRRNLAIRTRPGEGTGVPPTRSFGLPLAEGSVRVNLWPHHTTAMGTDLLRGNRLELPWFAGKVIELGRRHNIPTPVNGFIYSALKPYVDGAAY
jgi:hypothetical protein